MARTGRTEHVRRRELLIAWEAIKERSGGGTYDEIARRAIAKVNEVTEAGRFDELWDSWDVDPETRRGSGSVEVREGVEGAEKSLGDEGRAEGPDGEEEGAKWAE